MNEQNRREFLKKSASLALSANILSLKASRLLAKSQKSNSIDLTQVREKVLEYCEALRDKEGPYGCYRSGIKKRPDLYSSLSIAIIRVNMGEDLSLSLDEQIRKEWIKHINSFANSPYWGRISDGGYAEPSRDPLFTNGLVIAALGSLGGKQKFPVRLYDAFDTNDKVASWLEKINWARQWGDSHWFWGGLTYYSFSNECTSSWLDYVFEWLNDNLDSGTGWWRKGVPRADRHQPLGGSALILPIYQHHKRSFPYPERLIDSILLRQLPNGRWLRTSNIHVMAPLEYDVLYTLSFMSSLVGEYRRNEIAKSIEAYAKLVISYWSKHQSDFFGLSPIKLLWSIGIFCLLQRLCPSQFCDKILWSDIFGDIRFYQTDKVEIF